MIRLNLQDRVALLKHIGGIILLLGFVFCAATVLHAGGAKVEATGYVRVEQIDGVWWFIDADGMPFVSTGVNHIEPHLWLAPYNKDETLRKYGQDMVNEHGYFDTTSKAARKWINRQVEICRDLNFNTWGRHTHPAIDPKLYMDQVYFIVSMQSAPLAGWRERNGEGPRPDVFSRDFEIFLEERIKDTCLKYKDSKKLLGYLYTDIPSWVLGKADQKARDDTVMIYPWINAILPLGESSPGKWKWVDHLRTRYESPEEVARTWGLPVSQTYGISWYKLTRLIDWFQPADPVRAGDDMKSFMYQIADQWYGLHHSLIRKYDPNHLILGDKNGITWHYEWVLPALKKYVDVVTVQAYNRWEIDGKTAERIYQATGKPIYNGDGSHSFVNEHQLELGTKGFRTGAKNYSDVAVLYKETMEAMMDDPHIIGWHHCGFLQQWDAAERGDSPRNENGFLDPFENYITEWTDVIRDVNERASSLHANSNGN